MAILCNQEKKTPNCIFKEIECISIKQCNNNNLALWEGSPSLCSNETWCIVGQLHCLLMQRYYQHSMDQAVVASSWDSRCCGKGLCWPHSRPGISALCVCNDHPRALFRWGVHNGKVFLTEGWINVAWRREFPRHFPPSDYPTTYSSLIAYCVS